MKLGRHHPIGWTPFKMEEAYAKKKKKIYMDAIPDRPLLKNNKRKKTFKVESSPLPHKKPRLVQICLSPLTLFLISDFDPGTASGMVSRRCLFLFGQRSPSDMASRLDTISGGCLPIFKISHILSHFFYIFSSFYLPSIKISAN